MMSWTMILLILALVVVVDLATVALLFFRLLSNRAEQSKASSS